VVLSSTAEVVGVVGEEMLRCGRMEDRYNFWYFRYCPAREQVWYSEKGQKRAQQQQDEDDGGGVGSAGDTDTQQLLCKVVDQGHEGMRLLADLVEAENARLERAGSRNRVTPEQVLSVRMYIGSTFRLYNNALRARGNAVAAAAAAGNRTSTSTGASPTSGETGGETGNAGATGIGTDTEIPCRRSILLARRCLILMQAIPREHKDTTYRGVTGYLSRGFRAGDMGMDYAFFSTTSSEAVAADFASSAERHVVFEVQYVRACSGVDVEVLSVFPVEKEILIPPCTGLSLVDQDQDQGEDQVPSMFDEFWEESEGTGRVKVSPAVAN
jgi:hypothetical protein